VPCTPGTVPIPLSETPKGKALADHGH